VVKATHGSFTPRKELRNSWVGLEPVWTFVEKDKKYFILPGFETGTFVFCPAGWESPGTHEML
jgi:hypothetical protein